MTRKVLYVSGTRADFGLMRSTLLRAARHPGLEVSVCVTGAHLMPAHGMTVHEVESSGLQVSGRIEAPVESDDGLAMARSVGRVILGLADLLAVQRPDVVLLLGDRGEMLGAAIAAAHANTMVAHVHGGERSGTIDESVRHAISRFSHYHFVATEGSRERLVRMGERPDSVFVSGAPGLDDLADLPLPGRAALAAEIGFAAGAPIALLVYHPVMQDANAAGAQAEAIVAALGEAGMQVVCLLPNSDAGNAAIRQRFEAAATTAFRCFPHLPRERYLAWMAAADVMVGNSSSGIIEAPSFGLPVVNVGDRQRLRERAMNVVDCEPTAESIRDALRTAVVRRFVRFANPFGDGRAGERIVAWLHDLPLDRALLKKCNVY